MPVTAFTAATRRRQRQLIIPVIFRMIYCLGLRPGEARRLHRNDVDLTSGTVRIRESKGHKDRLVFMSADLHEYCRRYDAAIRTHHPDRIPFFPNRTGAFYHASSIDYWFHELLNAASTAVASAPSSPPRPYDLRHADVIETINRWTRASSIHVVLHCLRVRPTMPSTAKSKGDDLFGRLRRAWRLAQTLM